MLLSHTHTHRGHTVSQAVQRPQRSGLRLSLFFLRVFLKNKLKSTDATEASGMNGTNGPGGAPSQRTDGPVHSISLSRSLSTPPCQNHSACFVF